MHGHNHGTFTCETKAHSRAESGAGSAQHAAICGPSPPRRNFSTMKCSTTIYTIHIYEPRSGGPAATTEPQFQGENPDCQPRGLAPSQAAEQPPPHSTGTGGRRSAGGLTLPPQPSAGCPRSGPASWLFEPAPQWSAAAGTTTWRRPSAAWPSGRTPTVPMPGIAWTARCRWRGVQPEPLTRRGMQPPAHIQCASSPWTAAAPPGVPQWQPLGAQRPRAWPAGRPAAA